MKSHFLNIHNQTNVFSKSPRSHNVIDINKLQSVTLIEPQGTERKDSSCFALFEGKGQGNCLTYGSRSLE